LQIAHDSHLMLGRLWMAAYSARVIIPAAALR
jgi:hypothetical protein